LGVVHKSIIEYGARMVTPGRDQTTISADRFSQIPSVHSAVSKAEGFVLTASEPHVAIPALFQQLEREQLELTSLITRHVNLEDVFSDLTGRPLSDE
jgi:Zn-dependent alcohol dehydrogenase